MRMQNGMGVDLAERVAAFAPRVHAATAELVAMSAELDTSQAWAVHGMQSCAQWLAVNVGVSGWTGAEMVRVGHALEGLPAIREAFAAGRLSFDKVRAITRVATPKDHEHWLEVALTSSGGQLARICRGVRETFPADDPRRASDPLLMRGVRTWWRDDGMLELLAVLPAEEGAIVVAALDALAQRQAAEVRRVPAGAQPEDGGERLTQPGLRADALVQLCKTRVSAAATTPVVAPTTQMVVHVDAAVLEGTSVEGRSHIQDGPWLPPATVRRLACDADVVTMIDRDGQPLDVGRVHRLITSKQRLALHSRDGGCRYPGCSVPAARTDGHHVRHWPDGGKTNLDNLISLCRFHHRQHHEGKFEIGTESAGEFTFRGADGRPLQPHVAEPPTELREEPEWYATWVRGQRARSLIPICHNV
jgi:Domain of unknown function (DUF222)/HNH endonuclease